MFTLLLVWGLKKKKMLHGLISAEGFPDGHIGYREGIIKDASKIYDSAWRCLRQASFCNAGRLKGRCA
jgi:hypothetical protein